MLFDKLETAKGELVDAKEALAGKVVALYFSAHCMLAQHSLPPAASSSKAVGPASC